MTGNLVLLGLLAFASGSLFRAYAMSGLPVLRMFGTMGIALTGIVGAMTLTQAQVESARAEARRQLQALGPGFRLVPAPGGCVVIGPTGLTYCRFDAMPNYGRQAAVRRRLERSAAEALTAADGLQARLSAAGHGDVPFQTALVLLRRRAEMAQAFTNRAAPVLYLNPDTLRQALAPGQQPELVDAQRRQRLAHLLADQDAAPTVEREPAVRVTQ